MIDPVDYLLNLLSAADATSAQAEINPVSVPVSSDAAVQSQVELMTLPTQALDPTQAARNVAYLPTAAVQPAQVQPTLAPLPTLAPTAAPVIETVEATAAPAEAAAPVEAAAPAEAAALAEAAAPVEASSPAAVVAQAADAVLAAVESVQAAAPAAVEAPAPAALPEVGTVGGQTLEQFAAAFTNGQADQVTGVFVPDMFALPVIQQPWNQANFVSTDNNTVTQFALPSKHGVIGLLAHNYLSGERFFELGVGQVVAVVYGDGRSELYQITRAQSFQALSPTSPYSNFIDLADPNQTEITSAELFQRVYTTSGQVVFQTCIRAYGDPSWGRLFVTAEKIQ